MLPNIQNKRKKTNLDIVILENRVRSYAPNLNQEPCSAIESQTRLLFQFFDNSNKKNKKYNNAYLKREKS